MSWLCELACGIGTLLRNIFYLRGIEFWNTTNMKRLQYEMGNFCMGDVGGYGIADYLPRVPFLPKGPVIFPEK